MNRESLFVYVANSCSMEILVFSLDVRSGEIKPAHRVSAKDTDTRLPSASLPLAVSPDRRFMYAAIRSEPYVVVSFAIDGLSGNLTYLGAAPLPESAAYISTDRRGRFLFSAAIPTKTKQKPRASLISVSPIGQHGFVQPPSQIVRTEPKTHAILPDPANNYVLVTACDADCVLRYVFDEATGTLKTSLPPVRVKPNAGPRHFVFHPNNRHVYLINEADAHLYVFEYDAQTGGLDEVQIESALPPQFVPKEGEHSANGADVHITPDGRFLYASVRGAAQCLASFSIDAITGRLRGIGFVPTEKIPRAFAIDPYGNYLFVAGQGADNLTSYRINQTTGELTRMAQYATGKRPDWVEILRLP